MSWGRREVHADTVVVRMVEGELSAGHCWRAGEVITVRITINSPLPAHIFRQSIELEWLRKC